MTDKEKLTKKERKDIALKEYEKIESPAWGEYKKIKNTAWKEYEKKSKEIDDEPDEICKECGREL